MNIKHYLILGGAIWMMSSGYNAPMYISSYPLPLLGCLLYSSSISGWLSSNRCTNSGLRAPTHCHRSSVSIPQNKEPIII